MEDADFCAIARKSQIYMLLTRQTVVVGDRTERAREGEIERDREKTERASAREGRMEGGRDWGGREGGRETERRDWGERARAK